MRLGLDFDPSDGERASSVFHPRDDSAQRSTSMMTDDAEHGSRDYDSAVAELGGDFISGTATANGTTIHYVRGGRGPALVLLHGFPQDWFEWRRLMPRLAESFTVIAIDLRGVGGSAAPSDGYAAADLAEDVYQLLGALGVDRAHIVGHDTGGWVAYAFSRLHPRSTSSLLIMETPIPGIEPFQHLDIDVPLWHGEFHMIPDLPEALVADRQAIYFRHFFNVGDQRQPRHHGRRRRALRQRLPRPRPPAIGLRGLPRPPGQHHAQRREHRYRRRPPAAGRRRARLRPGNDGPRREPSSPPRLDRRARRDHQERQALPARGATRRGRRAHRAPRREQVTDRSGRADEGCTPRRSNQSANTPVIAAVALHHQPAHRGREVRVPRGRHGWPGLRSRGRRRRSRRRRSRRRRSRRRRNRRRRCHRPRRPRRPHLPPHHRPPGRRPLAAELREQQLRDQAPGEGRREAPQQGAAHAAEHASAATEGSLDGAGPVDVRAGGHAGEGAGVVASGALVFGHGCAQSCSALRRCSGVSFAKASSWACSIARTGRSAPGSGRARALARLSVRSVQRVRTPTRRPGLGFGLGAAARNVRKPHGGDVPGLGRRLRVT